MTATPTIPCHQCGERLPAIADEVQQHVNERHPVVLSANAHGGLRARTVGEAMTDAPATQDAYNLAAIRLLSTIMSKERLSGNGERMAEYRRLVLDVQREASASAATALREALSKRSVQLHNRERHDCEWVDCPHSSCTVDRAALATPPPATVDEPPEASLLERDDSEIAVVPDTQRNVWLTDEQRRQPGIPDFSRVARPSGAPQLDAAPRNADNKGNAAPPEARTEEAYAALAAITEKKP
jgi:hypothetical protein